MCQYSHEFDVNTLGVCLWHGEQCRILNCGCPFPTISPTLVRTSPSEATFWLDPEDCVFYSTPTRTCWHSPSHMRSVFAQLPPYWTMTALSLPVVLKSWQQAQMSAPGNVFVMLQFFFFCFRTAWMFLLHMFSSSCHQESSVCLFYIYFGSSHGLCYHTWPFIKTLSSAASKTIWPNWNSFVTFPYLLLRTSRLITNSQMPLKYRTCVCFFFQSIWNYLPEHFAGVVRYLYCA